MKKTLFILWAVVVGISSVFAGDISGTVKIQGAADNANAVVYIEKQNDLKVKQPEKEPVMDQHNLAFTPHVLPVVVGTTVKFKNSDKVAHNIFTPSPAGDMFNLGTWKGDQVKTHTFNKTGEVILLCNLHPEMEGYIYVTPTQYFCKTDAQGEFNIPDIPAGQYTLKLWSEHGNARPQKITVPASGKVTADFTVK